MSESLKIGNLEPPLNPLILSVNSDPLCIFFIPDYKEEIIWGLFNESFQFYPSVFSGDAFPQGDFEHPFMVEKLIGPYSVTYRYFDSDFNEVAKPTSPGRYGAIVEIANDKGPSFRRYGTLFK